MQITQPSASPSNATPQADTAAGAAGTGTPYSRSDHSHPFSGTVVTFQNAADAGKKFQHVNSAATLANVVIAGIVNAATIAVSWPATFGSTPNVWSSCSPGSYDAANVVYWAGPVNSVTTTGATCTVVSTQAAGTGTIQLLGLG